MIAAIPRARTTGLILPALGLSLVIAASAHITVPFWPVPMTLQTGAVLAIAGLFGARIAVAAMLLYLLEGALGLPVFATGSGPAVLIGPTAGYLLGMVFAAFIVGLADTALSRAWTILAATCVILFTGTLWLAGFVGLQRAVSLGLLPFLVGDIVKATLAWALATAIKPRT